MVKGPRHVRHAASDTSIAIPSALQSTGLTNDSIEWISKESTLKTKDGHLTVMSPQHYQALREAIAHNSFRRQDGSPWPTASLTQGGHIGHAQLIPPNLDGHGALSPEETQTWSELMWKQREQLSDLDVDVLDILSAIWLENASSQQDDALVNIDSLLELRGLSPRTNSQGSSSGYRAEQRAEVFQSVIHIQNLWLNMAQVDVMVSTGRVGRPRKKRQTIQSRAFVITDRLGQLRLDGCIDVEKFLFRPGKVFGQFLFGPGRQTALLSAKALQYDPYRQTWEKRLTRYFSWHWKDVTRLSCDAYPYTVKTLLESAGQGLIHRFPQRTKDRLEKALVTLMKDQVISDWHYNDWQDSHAKGWGDQWLETTILVKAPACIHQCLPHRESAPLALSSRIGESEQPLTQDFATLLRATRRKHKLSQAQAAQRFGITQAYFSKLETGKSSVPESNASLRQSLFSWVS